MAIVPLRGSFHVEYFPKTASTAIAVGKAVTILNSAAGAGTLIEATSSSPEIIGTLLKPIATTDSDYASTTLVPVLVPDVDAEYEAATSGAATTDIGEYCDITDSATVNVASYTYGVFKVTGIISATKVIGKITKKSGPAITTS